MNDPQVKKVPEGTFTLLNSRKSKCKESSCLILCLNVLIPLVQNGGIINIILQARKVPFFYLKRSNTVFKTRGQAVTPSRKQTEQVFTEASDISISASDISMSTSNKDQHKQLLADQAGCCRPLFQKMLC